MKYTDLRDFIAKLKQLDELKHVAVPVSPYLEMTEICDRTLRSGGPALIFDQPTGHTIPVLANLFGTPRRVALGMGAEDVSELRKIGQVLAMLKEPETAKTVKGVSIGQHEEFIAKPSELEVEIAIEVDKLKKAAA